MSYSIQGHVKSYELSFGEAMLATITLTGAPYAMRHKELSVLEDYAEYQIGHRILMVVQCIPGIGLLAAIVERIVVLVDSLFNKKFDPTSEIETDNISGNPAGKPDEKIENPFHTELVTFKPFQNTNPSNFGKLPSEIITSIVFFLSKADINNLKMVEKTLYNRCTKVLVDNENMGLFFQKSINLMFEEGHNPNWTKPPYKEDWFKPENREMRHKNLLETIDCIDSKPLFQDGVCINFATHYLPGPRTQATLLLQAVEKIGDPSKRIEVVALLLRKGADPTVAKYWYRCSNQISPIEVARKKNDEELLNLLTARV